jgi:hypothetical protein
MGPGYGPVELADGDAPGWWWQVLSHDSAAPVIGAGRADREVLARQLVEAQMAACEGSLLGQVIGPGGRMTRCLRTIGGGHRWAAAE